MTSTTYALAAAAALLLGCGGGGGAEPKEPAPVANEVVEPAPAAEQAPPPWMTGVPSCDLYIAKMELYLQCPKVPQTARDGARQGLDAMKSGWGDMRSMPPEAVAAADDACRQAVDALVQGASAMGCTI